MALDAAFLNVLCKELDQKLRGAKVDKIHMPSRDEAVFSLRTKTSSEKLLICARSGSARMHLTTEEYQNPDVPASFCMLLRKYLARARIDSVEAVPGERVALIHFTAVAETGDLMDIALSAEFMGRYSNLVLVRDGVVVDALKRITPDQSELRVLLPAAPFTLPPPQNKTPYTECTPESLLSAIEGSLSELSDALLSRISGFSPAVCREIAYRTVGSSAKAASQLSPAEQAALRANCGEVLRAANGEGSRLCIAYDGERAAEFSFVELTQYSGCKLRFFNSASELLHGFYCEKDRLERQKNLSRDLIKQISKLIDRAERKHEARLREQDNSELAQQKRLYGELLTAHIHDEAQSRNAITLTNYYSGGEVTIPLDPRLSLGANAQKYYKEYRKLTTASRMLAELLESDKQEIAYLRSVLYAANRAESENEFSDLREELKSAGYLRNFKAPPANKRRRPDPFLRYETADGFVILAGKNNAQNDLLTHKTAQKNDYWFHVKGYAGSHVVLRCDKEPGEAAMRAAVNIAALNSDAAGGEQVAVDYTRIKNVKKPNGAKPGMVIFTDYKTAYITPDKSAAGHLIKKQG